MNRKQVDVNRGKVRAILRLLRKAHCDNFRVVGTATVREKAKKGTP